MASGEASSIDMPESVSPSSSQHKTGGTSLEMATEMKHRPEMSLGETWKDRPKNSWTDIGVTPQSFVRAAPKAAGENQLHQTMTTTELCMIALGGSIGAGLFVGSGEALQTGGPASLVLAFSIIGIVSPTP